MTEERSTAAAHREALIRIRKSVHSAYRAGDSESKWALLCMSIIAIIDEVLLSDARSEYRAMSDIPRCLICGHSLAPAAQFDGGCSTCVGRVWADVLSLRDVEPDQLGVRVAVFYDWHVPFLARAVVGVVPFDGEPVVNS